MTNTTGMGEREMKPAKGRQKRRKQSAVLSARLVVLGLAAGSALKERFGSRLRDIAPDDPVWDSVAWTLAQLCQVIVCAAAPRRIAMGGGVIERQPHLLGRIEPMLVDSLNGFLRLPGGGAYVRAPELGADAGPLGAIALAMTARA